MGAKPQFRYVEIGGIRISAVKHLMPGQAMVSEDVMCLLLALFEKISPDNMPPEDSIRDYLQGEHFIFAKAGPLNPFSP